MTIFGCKPGFLRWCPVATLEAGVFEDACGEDEVRWRKLAVSRVFADAKTAKTEFFASIWWILISSIDSWMVWMSGGFENIVNFWINLHYLARVFFRHGWLFGLKSCCRWATICRWTMKSSDISCGKVGHKSAMWLFHSCWFEFLLCDLKPYTNFLFFIKVLAGSSFWPILTDPLTFGPSPD